MREGVDKVYIFKPLCESKSEVLANFSLNISAKIFIFTIFSIILQVYLFAYTISAPVEVIARFEVVIYFDYAGFPR